MDIEGGNLDGASKALRWGRGVNWAIVFAVAAWYFLAVRAKLVQ